MEGSGAEVTISGDSTFQFFSGSTKDQSTLTQRRPLGSMGIQNTSFSKKPKKSIDIRASKGRKIRYLKLPKAVDFMFPEFVNYFSDVQRAYILEQMKTTCK